jgi:hypothetical protein
LSSDFSDNGSDYFDHVEREESAYLDTFEKFYAGLTPAQRKQLADGGIHGALLNLSSTAELEQDAADTPAASYSRHPGLSLDRLSQQLAEKFGLEHSLAVLLASYMMRTIDEFSISYKAELFGVVCGEILNATNVKISVAGLAFASNLASLNSLQIKSQRAFAKTAMISPAAVSKSTKRWQSLLHLPHSPHMKNPESCENYSKVQKSDRHWRRQKATVKALREMRATNGDETLVTTKKGGEVIGQENLHE